MPVFLAASGPPTVLVECEWIQSIERLLWGDNANCLEARDKFDEFCQRMQKSNDVQMADKMHALRLSEDRAQRWDWYSMIMADHIMPEAPCRVNVDDGRLRAAIEEFRGMRAEQDMPVGIPEKLEAVAVVSYRNLSQDVFAQFKNQDTTRELVKGQARGQSLLDEVSQMESDRD